MNVRVEATGSSALFLGRVFSLCVLAILPTGFAANFVNLSFDQPDLSGPLTPIYPELLGGPFRGNTSDLLAGWTVLVNQTPQATMTYSPPPPSFDGHVTLWEYSAAPARPEMGRFGLFLESSPPNQVALALKQTGTIPVDATTLGLFANHYLEVRVNDQAIYTVDPNVTFYPYVDVSRFAGQTVDLEFRVIQGPFEGVGFGFDILGFQTVPEPSTYALLGVGLAALGWHSLRRKS